MSPEDDCYVRAHFVEVPDPGATLDADGGRPAAAAVVPARRRHPDGAARLPRPRRVGRWPRPAARRGSSTTGPRTQQDTAEQEWAAYLSGQYVCLRVGHPADHPPQDRARRAGQGGRRACSSRTRATPTARGSLGEATSKLDDLELPMTGYDRLRFGGPLSRETWIDAPRRALPHPGRPAAAGAHRAARAPPPRCRRTPSRCSPTTPTPTSLATCPTPPLDRRRGRGGDPAPDDPARRRGQGPDPVPRRSSSTGGWSAT